jgi:hypothetical protein
MNQYRSGWVLLRGLSSFWLALTALAIVSSYPPGLFSITVLGPVIVTIFSLLAVSKGNAACGRASLLAQAILFSISLISDTLMKAVSANLAILLLTFVMLLFGVEFLTLVLSHHRQISNWLEDTEFEPNALMVNKSLRDIGRKLARFGIIFAGCYVLTIGVLFVSEIAASLAPVQSDISVYVVLISISLALLIILRED